MLPEIVDIVKIKRWKPKLITDNDCFLYKFNSLGVTLEQFVDVIAGRPAILFEKPFRDTLLGFNCPWCDFKASRNRGDRRIPRLQEHIFTHPNKTILSYQLIKFQKELYTLRLQLVRKGFHEAMAFFVEHTCQDCLTPVVPGREGMCALPTTTRSRMRSLKLLNYPIGHLVKNKKRKHKWSALGVIVLLRTEISKELPMQIIV